MLRKTVSSGFQSKRQFFGKLFKSEDPTKHERRVVTNKFGTYEVVSPWTVILPYREVPSSIRQPEYYYSLFGEDIPTEIEIKNRNQIECMRQSCILAKRVLNHARKIIKPGITTDYLDEQLHDLIINNGAFPSPLKYNGFPKSICTSVNNVACHGIPDTRPLVEGDTLNVDVTVFLNGFHGDCSAMFTVGNVDDHMKRLIQTTEECLNAAIKICKPNEKMCNIGNVIEEIANKNEFSVIPAFVGHGIGSYFHGPPDVFHFANEEPGVMKPGMTFTIEPALTQGEPEVELLEDGWTAVTVDEARTAQMEHTVLITGNGCDILTL